MTAEDLVRECREVLPGMAWRVLRADSRMIIARAEFECGAHSIACANVKKDGATVFFAVLNAGAEREEGYGHSHVSASNALRALLLSAAARNVDGIPADAPWYHELAAAGKGEQ